MTWEQLLKSLYDSKLYFSKVVNVDEKGERRVVALWLYAAPLQKDIIMDNVQKIIGEEYLSYHLPNLCEIRIEKRL